MLLTSWLWNWSNRAAARRADSPRARRRLRRHEPRRWMAPLVEPLEQRLALTTISLNGPGDLVIQSFGLADDQLNIHADGPNNRFVIFDPGQILNTGISGATGSGTNQVFLPFSSVPNAKQLIVNTSDGNDVIRLTASNGFAFNLAPVLDGGDGFDAIELNAAVSVPTDDVNVMLISEDIRLGGDITTAGGRITFQGNVFVTHDVSLLTDGTTVDGDVEFFGQVDSSAGPGTYTLVTAPLPYEQARMQAGSDVPGGFLVTVRSAAEQADVHALAGTNSVWLGASDTSVEGQWFWESGPDFGVQFWDGDGTTGSVVGGEFSNWLPGEPDNIDGTAEGDAAFLEGSDPQGRWRDGDVTVARPYIVEAPSLFALSISAGGALVKLQGTVGNFLPLRSLTLNAGQTELTGGTVRTAEAQTFNSAVSLMGPTQLVAGEVDFGGGANSVIGSSRLMLAPIKNDAPITVGAAADAGPASFDLTDTDIAALTSGLVKVAIGESLPPGGESLGFQSRSLGSVTVTSAAFVSAVSISGGSISVTGLDVGTQTVELTAVIGTITDGGGGTADVTANELLMDSAAGIGASSDPLDLVVGAVAARTMNGGGVFLANTGNLVIGPAFAPGGIMANNDTVAVSSTGSITVNQMIFSAGGDVSLTATDGITINGVPVDTAGGQFFADADSNNDGSGTFTLGSITEFVNWMSPTQGTLPGDTTVEITTSSLATAMAQDGVSVTLFSDGNYSPPQASGEFVETRFEGQGESVTFSFLKPQFGLFLHFDGMQYQGTPFDPVADNPINLYAFDQLPTKVSGESTWEVDANSNAIRQLSGDHLADQDGTVRFDGGVSSLTLFRDAAGVSPGNDSIVNVQLGVFRAGVLMTAGEAITIRAADMIVDGMIDANTGLVTLIPSGTNRTVDLGSDAGVGQFVLTKQELDRISTTSGLAVGDTSTGKITINESITRFAATNFTLTAANGQDIVFSGPNAMLNTNGGSVTLTTGGTGAIRSGGAVDDLRASTISLNAGSGGIGELGNPLAFNADSLATATSSNGNQFLSEVNDLTIGTTGLNAVSGVITLDNGVFRLGGSNRIDDETTLSIGPFAALQLNGFGETLGGLSDVGSVFNGSTTAGGLTISGSGDSEFFGSLGGVATTDNNFSLTKSGPGTFTLSGTNTFTGTTTVNGGTLILNGSTTSATSVAAEATLGGSGTINGPVTINNGGTIAPGNSPGILNTGNLSFSGGSAGALTVSSYVTEAAGTGATVNPDNGGVELTDGLFVTSGTFAFNDAAFVNYRDDNPDDGLGQPKVVFDLGDTFVLDSIIIRYLHSTGAGAQAGGTITAPEQVLISVSNDGVTFSTPVDFPGSFDSSAGNEIRATILGVTGMTGRFVRVDIRQSQQHTFIDEISFTGGPPPPVFAAEVNGDLPGELHDQIDVTGTVNLGGATLSLSGTITSQPGQSIVLINNDGTDAINGTFAEVPEGATVSINGVDFVLSYRGGTGNDVTLTEAGTFVFQGTRFDDTLELREATIGGQDYLQIMMGGVLVEQRLTSSVADVSILGGDGSDVLTIDYGGSGGVFSQVVHFEGEDNSTGTGDALILTGGTFASITHQFTNANDGSIAINGSTAVNYTGLEPITDNLSATDRVFTFNGGTETITLTDAAGANMTIDSDLSESVTFANPTGSLTINAGTGDDTVTITSVDAAFNTALTISGGVGNDTVNLNADITFASGKSLDVDLQNDDASPGIDAINVGTNANLILSGSGAATLTASKSIALASGSSLVTVDGNLDVKANQQATATSGNFIGIDVNAAVIQATGTGIVTVQGKGGAGASGTQFGVQVQNGGQISGGTTGASTVITGTGGEGSGGVNYGVVVVGAGSRITSGGGDVSVTGNAGAAGGDNRGIEVMGGGQITSGGSGTVTVTGTGGGGSGAGIFHIGVHVRESSTITSGGGNVTVTGTGGGAGTSSNNFGVLVASAGQITAGSSATVTVTGTGGSGSNGSNQGVVVNGTGSTITSGSGNVSVTGVEGSGSSSVAVNVVSSGAITTATNGGTATVIGNSMNFDGTAVISAQSGSSVTLRQNSNNVGINLGAATDPIGGPLSLTDAELDRVTAGTVNIGNSNSGTITVSAAITHGNHLSLTTGAGITANQAITMAVDKNLTATSMSTSAGISLATTNSDVATSGTGTVSLTATRNIALASGSSVASTTGAITLNANASGTGTGTFDGVNVANTATISSTTGDITVTGLGGDSVSNGNHGVNLADTSAITSQGGNITLTGQGRGAGATQFHEGVIINGNVTNTGSGNITVNGTGGSAGSANFGVDMFTGATVSAVNGMVTINGVSGIGAGSHAIRLANFGSGGAVITTTGSGAIMLTANESAGSGVGLSAAGAGSAIGGASTAGNISITTNTISLAAPVQSSGSLTITPRTASTTIGIGGGSGTLNLDDTELTQLANGFSGITIGDAANGTGAVDVDSSTFADPVTIVGSSIAVTELNAGSNAVTLTARSTNITDGGDAGTDVTGGAVSLNATGGTIGASGDAVSLVGSAINTNTSTSNGGQFLSSGGAASLNNVTAGSGTLTLVSGGFTSAANQVIADATTLSLGHQASLDLANNNETIVSLILEIGTGNGADITTGTGTLTLGGDVTLNTISTGEIGATISGKLDLGGSTRTINVADGNAAADLSIAAVISGTSTGLTKSGAGTLSLTGTNTYTGATTINAGTLQVNGSTAAGSAVAVNNGGTLGGSGSVLGTVTVASGGTVAPGTSPGILNTGNVTFNSGSTFSVEVNGTTPGTQHDQLNVTGTVSLGGATLATTGTITSSGGLVIVLINNDGADAVSGTFNGLAEGDAVTINGVNFVLSYVGGTGNDVVLFQTGTLTFNGTSGDDSLEVRATMLSGQSYIQVLSGGAVVNQQLSSLVTDITINGAAGNDTLTVNYSANFAQVVSYNGQGNTSTPGDSLILTGGTFTSVTHNFSNANDGSVAFNGSTAVNYTGLEPITDNLIATDRVFTFGGTSETITLTDETGSAMTIDSPNSESVTFANPSGSLTINAGAGDDAVQISSVDANFRAAFTINGETGADTATLDTNLTLGAGAITGSVLITAETINLNANISTDLGTNAGSIGLNGAVQLGANVTLDSNSTNGADANITFGGTIDGAQNLTTNSGGAATTFSGAIGNATALTDLDVTAGTINLSADIKTDGGSLTFVGNTVLGAEVIISTEVGEDDSAGSVIFSGGSLSATGADQNLTITTVTNGPNNGGSVTFARVDNAAGNSVRYLSIYTDPLGGGAAGDVTFTDSVSLASDGNLYAEARTISLSTSNSDLTLSGTANVFLSALRNIDLAPGSSIQAVDGDVTLDVNQFATPTNGNFTSIQLDQATIRTTGIGSIGLLGRSGDAGNLQYGILLQNASLLEATGAGEIELIGESRGTSGPENDGILIASGSDILSNSGQILLRGIRGVGGTSEGIGMTDSGITVSATSAPVFLIADVIHIGQTQPVISAGAGNVIFLRPITPGTAIGLGAASSSVFSLSDAQLDRLTADAIEIGDADSGTITISNNITRPSATSISLITGGNNSIVFNGSTATLDSNNGSVVLSLNSAGTGAITSGGALKDVRGTLVSLTSGSGGIGASGNSLILDASTVNASTTGNAAIFLEEIDSVTINAIGLTAGSGAITLTSGTFRLGGSNRVNDGSALDVSSGATFQLNGFDETIASLKGSGSVLNGTTSASTLTVNLSGTETFAGVLGGASVNDKNFGLSKSGNGTLTLSGANTYTGATTISAGSLKLGASNVLSDATAVTIAASGTLDLANFGERIGSLAGAGILATGGTPFEFGADDSSTAFSGSINGGGQLIKLGSGVFTLSGTIGAAGGNVTINGGTFRLGAANRIHDSRFVAMNSPGVLDLNGFDETIGGLNGSTGNSITLGTGTLTTGGLNIASVYQGTISGTGGLTKSGTANFTLTGANTYSGATSVNAGTLLINGSMTSNVTVASGATVAGTGTINSGNTLTVQSGGTVAPGTSPGILNSGSATLQSGSAFNIELNGTTVGSQYDQLNVTGTVTIESSVALVGSLGFTPNDGDTFVIINNDGSDAISGTFNGLAQGALLTIGGEKFHIIYNHNGGGDGNTNDVALVANRTPVVNDQSFSISESSANNAVVGTVLATDTESALTFAITAGNTNSTFSINTSTGQIRVADESSLDFESNPTFSLTVEITDDSGASDTATITINLTNVAPAVPADEDAAANSVSEAAFDGDTVGINLSSLDPHGGAVMFRLTNNASGRFAIHPVTGVVTVANASLLNFETATSHTITVEASDGTSPVTQSFTISVMNVAPSIPSDADGAANSVSEGATNGDLVGIDADSGDVNGGTISFSLTDDAGGRFAIHPVTGIVRVADASLLDFESGTSHQITIQVSDGRDSTTRNFTIDVTNVAPTIPIDADNSPNLILDTAIDGDPVGIDADSQDVRGGSVTFSLTDDAGGRFAINQESGVVTIADVSLLDFEFPNIHTIVVQATDETDSSTRSFTINVGEGSPDAPLDVDSQSNTAPEGALEGSRVGITLQATDPQGETVFYRLTDDAGGRFAIDPLTGVVMVKDGSLLRFAESSRHVIRAVAVDAQGSVSEEVSFDISVTQVPADALPLASILPTRVNVVEGDAGPNFITFVVKLNKPSAETITIDFSTRTNADGGFQLPEGIDESVSFATDEPGPWDFFRSAGRLTFDPGVTEQPLRVQIRPDDREEDNELFFVQLLSPVNVRLAPQQSIAIAQILDDDLVPQLIIENSQVLEGDSAGQNELVFSVRLIGDLPLGESSATVDFLTGNIAIDTALSGTDYTSTSGTLTFTDTDRVREVRIPILGDVTDEANETVSLRFENPVHLGLSRSEVVGTIINDDSSNVVIALTPQVFKIRENNDGSQQVEFLVTLIGKPTGPVSVDYTTTDETALAGSDYTATSGTIEFTLDDIAIGNVQRSVFVTIAGDTVIEPDETLSITLSLPAGSLPEVSLAPDRSSSRVAIRNDDQAILTEVGDALALALSNELTAILGGGPKNNPALIAALRQRALEIIRTQGLDKAIVLIIDPVDFVLTDPDGRQAGYSEGTGVVNEIPGTYYSGDGAVELLIVPLPPDGTYNVQLAGLGGDFNASITVLDSNGTSTNIVSQALSEGATSSVSFQVGGNFIPIGLGLAAAQAGGSSAVGVVGAFGQQEFRLALASAFEQAVVNALQSDGQDAPSPGLMLWLSVSARVVQQQFFEPLWQSLGTPFGDWLSDGRLTPRSIPPELVDQFWSQLGQTLTGVPSGIYRLGDMLESLIPTLLPGRSRSAPRAGEQGQTNPAPGINGVPARRSSLERPRSTPTTTPPAGSGQAPPSNSKATKDKSAQTPASKKADGQQTSTSHTRWLWFTFNDEKPDTRPSGDRQGA